MGVLLMTGKVLTFYLGNNLCGIDIAFAKEINRKIKYTSVSGGTSHVVGLLNLRGQVVSLFDLNQVLNFNEKKNSARSQCIILKDFYQGDQVGFFIDKLGEVVDVTPDICELPPANIRNIESPFIAEVVKLQAGIILVLDIKKVFDVI
jgi:purine-binding chemotaxis protein CheW